ncbi:MULTISPECIES: bleomycin resistance protein [Sphingobacterium]|uniref:bleomycin resistance protein n=1 Tax=Sphingobacterium TaxID=28453 RepID=UPI0019187A67|nr:MULTISPECIES: VOC family protein [Sphingobacterium]QQT25589.1 VOC family protein [Sphingobacterium spiritivorum]
MLTAIHPKLPMRDKVITQAFYTKELAFEIIGDYGDYLMIRKENIEIHFFLFRELDPLENYGQVYIRTDNIEECYQSLLDNNVSIHPNGPLEIKPWGQQEFSILDPDNNLLTFGQAVV